MVGEHDHDHGRHMYRHTPSQHTCQSERGPEDERGECGLTEELEEAWFLRSVLLSPAFALIRAAHSRRRRCQRCAVSVHRNGLERARDVAWVDVLHREEGDGARVALGDGLRKRWLDIPI